MSTFLPKRHPGAIINNWTLTPERVNYMTFNTDDPKIYLLFRSFNRVKYKSQN